MRIFYYGQKNDFFLQNSAILMSSAAKLKKTEVGSVRIILIGSESGARSVSCGLSLSGATHVDSVVASENLKEDIRTGLFHIPTRGQGWTDGLLPFFNFVIHHELFWTR